MRSPAIPATPMASTPMAWPPALWPSALWPPALWPPALLALLVLAVVPAAHAAPLPAGWTGPNLERREVSVLSIANGRVRYVDADRNVNDASLAGVVRFRFGLPGDAAPPGDAASGRLVLTDGQAFAGQPAVKDQPVAKDQPAVKDQPAAGDPPSETLLWSHPTTGLWEVSLERVASVRMPVAPGPANPATGAGSGAESSLSPAGPALLADELALANGDVLRGFIAGVDSAGVWLEPEAGGSAGSFAWSSVAGLRLANPAAPAPAGDFLELADGSRFAVADARFDGEAWQVRRLARENASEDDPAPAPATLSLPAQAVVALAPGASGLRLATLDRLVVGEPAPARAFGVAFPARRVGGAVAAHAPTTLAIDAPGESSGFRRARVRVALSPEAAASPLASVDVSLGSGDPVRLRAGHPRAELHAGPSSGPLRLRIDEAEHGPVLDRVVIEAVELLIEPASGG